MSASCTETFAPDEVIPDHEDSARSENNSIVSARSQRGIIVDIM